MTPKLYDKVNEKLAGVWGEYAGWAHSVSSNSIGIVYLPSICFRYCSLQT